MGTNPPTVNMGLGDDADRSGGLAQMIVGLLGGDNQQDPGNTANQWIQNKSYLEMMKKMLAGGAKMTLDGKANTFNIGGESSALGSLLGSDDNKSQGFQMDNWDSVA